MLAIVSPEECYASYLLDSLSYKKKKVDNNFSIYECEYDNHVFVLLISGYGKVGMTNALRYLIDNYNIKIILSIGTGGAISGYNDIFDVVIPRSTLQFDVDYSPLGYNPGQFPNVNEFVYKTNEEVNELIKKCCINKNVNYVEGSCASADMFVNNHNLSNSIKREYNAFLVDCESGVIGEFCHLNNIEYSCIKVVSNFANESAVKHYKMYDEEAGVLCQKITNNFLKLFYKE